MIIIRVNIIRKPGDCVIAMRPGDKWHGHGVAVTKVVGNTCHCMLQTKLFAALVSQRGSKKRKGLESRTFTHEELW